MPRAPSTVSKQQSMADGSSIGSASGGKKMTKKKSVGDVIKLLRSLMRGSVVQQLAPLTAFAMAKTALIHFSARTQGAIFEAVFLGDFNVFAGLLARNLVICGGSAVVESTKVFAESAFALRWRRQLTERIHGGFFSGTVYYRLAQLDRRISNPGDRIAGDVPLFTEELAKVVVEGGLATTDAAFFLYQMQKTGGMVSIFAVLGYVAIGGTMVFGLAPNLARLHGRTRELEGRFRGLHARLGQWSESVAFIGGERAEFFLLHQAFKSLRRQTESVLWRTAWYRVIFDFFVKYVATSFAIGLIIGPFFGGMRTPKDSAAQKAATLSAMRYHTDVVIGAFGGVGALAGAFNQIVHLGGYAARIMELLRLTKEHQTAERHEEVALLGDAPPAATAAGGGDGDGGGGGGGGGAVTDNQIAFENLTVITPTGVTLVKDLTLRVPPGTNLLVTGPNGAGKSSLFRVLGGLWRPKSGTVMRPGGQRGSGSEREAMIYVPQRPYVSIGTLREQLTYPRSCTKAELPDSVLRPLLARVDLEHLLLEGGGGTGGGAVDVSADGDAVVDWGEMLTLGEQQRLGLARLFHARPQYAILDECTSAVTMAMEERLCDALRDELGTTCITISHRPALVAVHHLNLALDGQGGFEIKQLKSASEKGNVASTSCTTHVDAADLVQGKILATAPPLPPLGAAAADTAAAAERAGRNLAPKSTSNRRWLVKLLIPKFFGAEGGRMYLLGSLIIAKTYLSDRIAHLNGESLRHIIGQDQRAFTRLIAASVIQSATQAVLAPSILSLAEAVALSWRSKLTAYLTKIYLSQRGFYTTAHLDGLSDADQRIAEDVPKLCTNLAALFPGLIKPIVDIVWFSVRMWQLTGRTGVAVLYGYMVFGLGLLRMVAPDFGTMEATASQNEGAFRHAHARLQKHAESVAFCGGGDIERVAADGRFATVVRHAKYMLGRRWRFGVFEHFVTKELPHNVTWGLSMLFVLQLRVSSTDVLSLRQQGDLGHDLRFLATTVSHSFIAFGELLDLYKKVAELGGYASRIDGLVAALESGAERASAGGNNAANQVAQAGEEVRMDGVSVATPNGVMLAHELRLRIRCSSGSNGSGTGGAGATTAAAAAAAAGRGGGNLLITGPNGSGKTSICRVICGLWPASAAAGTFAAPPLGGGSLAYVSQRPYLAVGTLREQLTYPHKPDSAVVFELAQRHHAAAAATTPAAASGADLAHSSVVDRVLAELLSIVGLAPLLEREYEGQVGWDAATAWEETLSLGEQQRLCMARLFFSRPALAILDECTNATSVDIEDLLYCTAQRFGITVITVSQRPALVRHHQTELHLKDGRGDWLLRELHASGGGGGSEEGAAVEIDG